MTRLRVGVAGLSHDHVWSNLAAVANGMFGQLVAAVDPDPRLRARLEQTHGGVQTHSAYDDFLARTDLDAVLVFADNRTSAELGVAALGRGWPVMVEKPMAADLGGAEALLAAGRAAALPLMINWPTVWRPALRHGLTLAPTGAVGEPVQLSHRGGHAGPREFGCSPQFCEWLYDPTRNGGGALVDYCGYGALLCRTLMGQPHEVAAVAACLRKEGLPAEDSAIVVLRYPRSLGLLEASWTQIGNEPAFAMVVYGDAGTLVVHQPRALREGQPIATGRIELVTGTDRQTIDVPSLPPDERDGPTYFLARVREGRLVEGWCAPEVGRDVQEILEAALVSSATSRSVALPLADQALRRREAIR